MSFLALPPHPAPAQAPQDPQAHWITPEKQLERLALSQAKVLVDQNRNKLQLLSEKALKNSNDVFERSIIECVARSILRRSDLGNIVPKKKQILPLMDLIVEHLLKPGPLPKILTIWYKALNLIGKLPSLIPPLPVGILKIIESECPKQIKKKGWFFWSPTYRIKDYCSLMLFSKELKNLDNFANIVESFWNTNYPQSQNPFDFNCPRSIRERHEKTSFKDTYWILHTNGLLENSRGESYYANQVSIMKLAAESGVNWQIPNLLEPILTIVLTKLATGKRLFPARESKYELSTYTRVEKIPHTIGDLAVGGTNHFGVTVSDFEHPHYDEPMDTGIASVLRLTAE